MSDGLAVDLADLSVVKRSGGSAFQLVVPQLQIRRGAKVALVGPSGCGKSTLLDVLSMIAMPAGVGRFTFAPAAGVTFDVGSLLMRRAVDRLAAIRGRWLGYVLQTGGLLPFLSVRANINLSRALLGMPEDGTTEETARLLGIAQHLKKLPSALSIGERQRVAIGRALAHRPAVVIADEPTASLDPHNAASAMRLFVGLAERFGATVIVASHDIERVKQFGLKELRHRFLPDQGDGIVRSQFET